MGGDKAAIISKLQQDILRWQGFTPPAAAKASGIGLGPLEAAFPNGVFPTGAIHEFLSFNLEDAAASGGLICGLIGLLVPDGGACLWISQASTVFPPALKAFNIEPDRIVFVDLHSEHDVLWVMEEALKCEGLTAVIGEVAEINVAQSRRLQLAVESSRVTGFVLRNDPRKLSNNVCAARWQVSAISSEAPGTMPGVGFPRWQIELLKVKNGNGGSYVLEWQKDKFISIEQEIVIEIRKVG